MFHVLEVKKKYALKNNFEKYFKGDFVVPQDYFRNGGGMYINVPQDYKSSGAWDLNEPQDYKSSGAENLRAIKLILRLP